MSLATISFMSTIMLFITHWASIQFYATYCAPPGFKGLLTAFIQSPSPVCIGANYLQFHSIQLYYTLWISILLSFCKLVHEKILEIRTNILETNTKNECKYKKG